MVKKENLELLAEKNKQLLRLKREINEELSSYQAELLDKAIDVLEWKDNNLGKSYLKDVAIGHYLNCVHEIRDNCIMVRLYNHYGIQVVFCDISFNELYTDDWKMAALEAYEKEKV